MFEIRIILLTSASLFFAYSPSNAQIADTVYTNGKIYTVNETQPWAEAVAIKDGKFIGVGTSTDMRQHIDSTTDVIDLSGKFAMPGIQENHVHVSVASTAIDKVAGRLQITTEMTPDEIQQALADYAKENPEGWIRGGQWGLKHFKDGRARKDLIDEVISDRAVVLINEDFHGAVANSKALELGGITKDSPQPSSGMIETDPETGEPTGFLADGGMFDVISKCTPPTVDQWREAIATSQKILHGYGITAVTDAAANRGALEAFKSLDDAGELKMRVDFVIMMNDYMGDVTEPWKILEDRRQYTTRLIKANKAKWGADGVPIAGTSLMLEPYDNKPESYGQMTATDRELNQFSKALGMGAQLMVHSVGDGTARKVLDAVAKARALHPENKLPVQLAHAVFVHPDDIKRMKELNVIAEISPPMYFWDSTTVSTIPVLGKERIKRAHPINRMLEEGLLVTYGSDWPASAPTANPWRCLEGMVTRLNPEGKYKEYGPLGEPIELAAAIRIFTINGAAAMGNDQVTGSIEVGKYADMVLLDQSPFDLMESGDAEKIGDMKTLRTLFEGEIVFDRQAAIKALDVIDVDITNQNLNNAVDAAQLNLLVEKDLAGGVNCRCFPGFANPIAPGSSSAPDEVNRAFGSLLERGYRFARHARQIAWKDEGNYWIQWALRDYKTAVLFAYDPESNAAVEVLRVKENR